MDQAMDSISTDFQAGPSWARDNWPQHSLDDLNAGLDPTQQEIAAAPAKAKAAAQAAGASPEAIQQAATDSIQAMMLIRTYRVRGHLAAALDPLGLTKREDTAELTPLTPAR